MGADIKKLRIRIKSVDSTLHLTRAMGLVASSKIRRAMAAMENGRAYERAVRDAIRPLLFSPECQKSPYMRKTDGARTCLVVIAGDRGLAGGYNANIFRALREHSFAEIIPIGKRACDRFGGEPLLAENFSYTQVQTLARRLCDGFAAGEYDRVAILGTRYISMLEQEPIFKGLLPLLAEGDKPRGDVIFEPDEASVLDAAVPEYVAGMLISTVRESFAAEVAARRTAMDAAGKNAEEMIAELQLAYNRARQGAITQEITEIVAGSGM